MASLGKIYMIKFQHVAIEVVWEETRLFPSSRLPKKDPKRETDSECNKTYVTISMS